VIRTTKDGRTIRSGPDYTEFRRDLWRQNSMCSRCFRITGLHEPIESNNSFHVHHTKGRGMGGSKRDDTAKACVGLCGQCHRREHGQG
jgi:hypothetical protein